MQARMGHFTAIGMRDRVEDPNALVINTCGKNDTAELGDDKVWAWANPTNRAKIHNYAGCQAVSVECLWQGMKIFVKGGTPILNILEGNWRGGKGRKPIGAWAGEGRPLITNPGDARRKIYIPAYRALVEHWLAYDAVWAMIEKASNHSADVYLRDFDTGRGLDRRGPMSHAWVLAVFLNTGAFPD